MKQNLRFGTVEQFRVHEQKKCRGQGLNSSLNSRTIFEIPELFFEISELFLNSLRKYGGKP